MMSPDSQGGRRRDYSFMSDLMAQDAIAKRRETERRRGQGERQRWRETLS